jgi:large subunit ribosomal protein L25
LPADLPEFIEIDLTDLEAGATLHVKDIKLPKGVELVSALEQENPVILTATVPAAAVSEDSDAAQQETGGASSA